MPVELPDDYVAYVEGDGVAEAITDGMPGYFQLWHPDDIEPYNEQFGVVEYAPGFLGFGSDGGGEILAFDAAGVVYMLPMVGMEPKYAKRIANSWSEIVQRITEKR